MEFHAIILCGEGRNLSPFSSVRSSGMCKALLPIANKPMVSYPISWCEKAEFSKITVAVTSRYYEEVRSYVEKNHVASRIEVVGIDDAKYSGEVLLQLASRITSDFVILPCDFITDVDPEPVINVHRNNQGGGKAIVSGIYYRNNLETIDKKSLISDYVVHTPDNKPSDPLLLDIYTKDEVLARKVLEVRMSMLWRFPYSVVSGKILRASIFFCSYKVLEILANESSSDAVSSTRVNAKNKNIDGVIKEIARRSWRHRQPLETVAMHIIPSTHESDSSPSPDPTIFIRANNVSAYLEANRYIMRLQAKKKLAGAHHTQPAVKGQATIGADSAIGNNTEVAERTSIKRTVVGHDCKIGKKCRITGCVVLDGVIIEDEVVLENCVIGKGCLIRSRAKLTSCNVEGQYEVRQGLQTKNELLQNLTMESLRDGDSDSEALNDSEAVVSSSEGEDSDGESGSQWEVSEGEDIDEDDDGLFDRS